MKKVTGQRCLREKDLLKIIPFSKSTLWRKIKDGTFPAPVKISVKVTVWLSEDIDYWFNTVGLTFERGNLNA